MSNTTATNLSKQCPKCKHFVLRWRDTCYNCEYKFRKGKPK
ncbi:hypothetical protein CH11_gp01 [Acinetobacter phage IMEAB3]|uniref:Uncharacterized protein n=1 Tax=Acinetobacter phage IMEAB3 TaxID=1458669 RepID=W6ASB9_9CAUD|nr:hypothetical protein CH11_gp01 [Acinetobacter phage IMEAB3]AHI60000.1 hypothetical protein IME_AB3_01 [Acinetobacter phage IMEAB3]